MNSSAKQTDLSRNNRDADKGLTAKLAAIRAGRMNGTRYSQAGRVKGDELLKANVHEEHWPGGRTDFAIDRDQVLFNPAFVRLARKAQVLVGQTNVFFKNRLMHTLEMVQFCRSVAEKHGLNVDLTEAIAYGHDIGHTPFGHSGEEILNACLCEYYVRKVLGFNTTGPRGVGSDIRKGPDAGVDHYLWVVLQHLLGIRKPSRCRQGLPSVRRMTDVLGAPCMDRLKESKMLRVRKNGEFTLSPPWEWRPEASLADEMKGQFWIQKGQPKFFAHYLHGLRILLCNEKQGTRKDQAAADVTFQTAYGILSHSWTGPIKEFRCHVPKVGEVVLAQDLHETPEAFLVRMADDICFTNSDLLDAFRAGVLCWSGTLANMTRAEMLAVAKLSDSDGIPEKEPSASERLQFCERGFNFTSSTPIYKHSKIIKKVREDVIKKRFYPPLARRQYTAKHILRDLFWYFTGPRPELAYRRPIDDAANERFNEYVREENLTGVSRARKVTDYLAHFTDEEAIGIHQALFAAEQAPWARRFLRVAST